MRYGVFFKKYLYLEVQESFQKGICYQASTVKNELPLCSSCNSRKGASTVDYRDPATLAAFLDRFGW